MAPEPRRGTGSAAARPRAHSSSIQPPLSPRSPRTPPLSSDTSATPRPRPRRRRRSTTTSIAAAAAPVTVASGRERLSNHRAVDAARPPSTPSSAAFSFYAAASPPQPQHHLGLSRPPTAKRSNPAAVAPLSLSQPAGVRDSFISIVDDPFFQRIHDESWSPVGLLHGLELSPAPTATTAVTTPDLTESRDEPFSTPRWPPPRRESLTIEESIFSSQTQSQARPKPKAGMDHLNIAIIGATGVGKSSFVQRLLGQTRPPATNASHVRVPVDGALFNVTLLELDLEYFDMNPSLPIQWPRQINGHPVPRVDGALILYDVMNRESIVELPETLAALTNSGLPAVLVACKCDNPESARQVDTGGMANHELFKSCVATYNVSVNVPESARACLNTILKAAVANRKDNELAEQNMSRRRAASAANLDAPDISNGRPISQHSKHSRASSDLSLLRGFQPPPIPDHYRNQSPRIPYMSSPQPPSATFGPDVSEDPYLSVSGLRSTGVRLDRAAHDSFLDIDESDAESFRYSDDIPILQRNDDSFFEKPARMAGVTFDELVDRLLLPVMTKAEKNFADVFLCLYRKFAAPAELFSAILTRLERDRDDPQHYLTKAATQLRIIEVVAKWVATYPGDFARPATRKNLEKFIKRLSSEPIFALAAQAMRGHLEHNVVEDDDTGWAKSDETVDEKASKILSKDAARDSDLSFGVSSLDLDDDKTLVMAERRPSGTSSEYSHLEGGGASSVGSQHQQHVQFASYEEYEREAAALEPTDTLPMNKNRYHIFMDTLDDDLADEITRIDWIMFSSIRIRDFVRHVSLPMDEKEKCRSLKNVNRMISHFNHTAKWVANMILLRDKAKHRAQMLEKFMNVALKLRQLNNYNGLAAVLAGINGTAIHRLSQTRGLVPAEVQKKFARLVILMGTQKSHFAYRLAWENSPLPRIPFMPLHRRDLVSAEEGSRTFVGPRGDRINWKKFEVLGEVLLPIMKSQGTPYPNLTRHEGARELIMDCRMPTDEDEIFQRSLEVETGSGGTAESSKKRFPWFAKQ